MIDDLSYKNELDELIDQFEGETDPGENEDEEDYYWKYVVTETWRFNGQVFELQSRTIEEGELEDE